MSRAPRPDERPALLSLAVQLAPQERRDWLLDMADEYAHVAVGDRSVWLLGTLGLALRWRLAALRTVSRPQLAIAVMALTLLVGSPWLLRRYLLQTGPLVTEAVADADRRDSEPGAGLSFTDEIGTARDAIAEVLAAPNDTAAGRAASTAAEQDVAEAEGMDVTGEGPLEAREEPAADPAAGQAASGAADPTVPAAATPPERQTPAVVAVDGATLSVSALRTTRVELRSGAADDGEAVVDRVVEAGERFLLLLPARVTAGDGGAIEIDGLGPLGPDGASTSVRFVSRPADGRDTSR